MTDFEFYSPTNIIFGRGVVTRIGTESRNYGKKALLLYGKESLKKNGLFDIIVKSLTDAGIRIVEHGGVEPNPVLPHALKCIEIARRESVDFIVAAGGGSVIDESKGIAAGVYSHGNLWDYYRKVAVVQKALPIIAVQTQPATSSETNQAGVLTNPESGEKFSIRSPLLVPKAAFLDPSTTFTIPVQYTAYACFDIMSHLLEGYFTTTASFSPIQNGFVEGMVKGIMESLSIVLEKPDNYDARASIMWGAALAWNGLANAGLEGAKIPSHMLEHPMSALHNIAHGAGLSIVMPAWLRYKKTDIADRIIRFGIKILELKELKSMDKETACEAVISRFEQYILSIGCPLSFTEAGIDKPDLNELARQVKTLSKLWNIPGYSDEDIKNIFKSCL